MPLKLVGISGISLLLTGCLAVSAGPSPRVLRGLDFRAALDAAGGPLGLEVWSQGSSSTGGGDVDEADDEFTVSLTSGDHGDLLLAFRDELVTQIESRGGVVTGRGESGTPESLSSFALRYSAGTRSGMVRVFSVETRSEKLRLIVVGYEHP